MPIFEFTSPEGKKYRVTGPDGSTPDEAFSILQQQMGGQEPKKQTSVWEDVKIGAANAGEALNTFRGLHEGSMKSLVGDKEGSEKSYTEMEKINKSLLEWANPEKKEQSFGGKLTGLAATLPAQLLAMPTNPAITGKTMIDEGESLTRAIAGSLLDTAGNVAGVAIPGALGTTAPAKVATGAAGGALQDVLTRTGISAIAEKQSTKDKLGPSWESAGLSAALGGALGPLVPGKKAAAKQPEPPKPNLEPVLSPFEVEPAIRESAEAKHRDIQTANRLEAAIEKQNVPYNDVIFVGREGNAIPGETGRAMAESTKGIEYEAIPPDGVIPRDSAKTGVEVPRGNQWIPDENNIPVRQNLPENKLLPPETYHEGPEVNALGNAVQEANGPRLGPDDVFGSENLHGPMGAPDLIGFPKELPITTPAGGIKVPRGQRGALDFGTAPKIPTVAKDSVQHPTSPETIAERGSIRARTNASAVLKDIAPEYSSITTPEEALHLAKQMGPESDVKKNPVRDATISGINGQVFLHRNNPLINMTRYVLQEARNISTKFSRDFVTGKDGVATLLGKLKDNDLIVTMEHLQEASKKRIELTAESVEALPISREGKAAILSVRRAFNEQYILASTRGRMEVGREAFAQLPGYLPGVMDKGYKSLVGVMVKGKFQVKGIAQASTRNGHKAEVEAMKKLVGEGATVVPLPRVGLKQAFQKNGMFNGFNELLNTIAKNDPAFEQLQQLAQMKADNATHQMLGFNVHELDKKGIRGVVGDSLTRTRIQNAKDLRKALVDNLEQGAEYYAHQKAAGDIHKILYSPDTAHLPNTRELIQKHLDHVEGKNLNALGNLANVSVDMLAKIAGVDGRVPLGVAREMRTLVGLHMMSIWNPAFTALQFTQLLTGALPEMLKVGSKLGMAADIHSSAEKTLLHLPALSIAKRTGKPIPDFIPEHTRAAFQYAQDHGIMTFSELESAHKASRNKYVTAAENAAAWNIIVGEKGTRPAVFLVFSDIFHNFGLSNEEAFMAAQHTTGMAMGDYHMAERPQIYSSLGVLGEFGGALTTFKHNALTNLYVRNKDVWKKDVQGHRTIIPAAAALAGLAIFQGIRGSPGYDELDAIYQWATSMMGERRSIAEDALQNAPQWLSSGLLSAENPWGLDFQSRTSMAKVLPEAAWSSLSPQAGVLGDIGLKAYEYGKYRDQQSWNALMTALTPGGAKGMVEDVDQGFAYNAAGEQVPEQARTKAQQSVRKWTGIRPLKETLDSKDVYVRSKSLSEQEDALQKVAQRYRQAYAAGDITGMAKLKDSYLKKGGDPQTLDNPEMLKEQVIRSNQSQRDRYAGQPAANMQSLRRQERMYPQH